MRWPFRRAAPDPDPVVRYWLWVKPHVRSDWDKTLDLGTDARSAVMQLKQWTGFAFAAEMRCEVEFDDTDD